MLKRVILLALAVLLILAGCGRTPVLPELSPTARPTETAQLTETDVPAVEGGGKVAAIQYGDVWVKPLPDGEAVRLTEDGLNAYPLWSPSGRYLAYRKDIELMTIDTVSGVVRSWASPVGTFAWSPVEDRLAYVAGSGILRLAVIDLDGGGEVMLIPPEIGVLGRIGDIAWRPDGQAIVYEWNEGRDTQGLYAIPSEGGAATGLYASGKPEKGDALVAGWTGDGRYLLFWQGAIVSASQLADGVPLYALPVDGGEPAVLADEVLYHDDFVVPARDSGAVALVAGSGRGVWTRKQVAVANVASGEITTLSLQEQAAVAPSWSPDGTQVAYVAIADEGDLGGDAAHEGLLGRRIWLSATDGGGPIQVTDDPAYRDESPFWSADGKSLLFVRMDANDAVSLWWLDVASREATQVVDGVGPLPGPAEPWFGYYGHMDWTPVLDWWPGAVESLP